MAKPFAFSSEKQGVERGNRGGTHPLDVSGENAVSTERSEIHARLMS